MTRNNRLFVLTAVIVVLTAALLLTSCEKTKEIFSAPGKAAAIKGPSVKILFAGDTSFGESYPGTPRLLKKRGYDYPMQKVAPMLKNSDFVIANLETPVTDLPETPFKDSKEYCHWTHVKHAPETFAKYNMFTFALANNHTLDYGVPGLQQSFDVLRANNMSWFGAGMTEQEAAQPFVKEFDVDGKPFKMAVIAAFEYSTQYDLRYNFYAKDDKPGAYRLTPDKIVEQIKAIKQQDPSTYVVVFPHWGKNYAWKTKKQTQYARAFIDAGADTVIGHGGHSMQEIEKYKGKWIVYGLGNFIFLSPGRYAKLKTKPFSYTAQLIAEKNGDGFRHWMKLYPIFCDNKKSKFQTRPLNDEEFTQFEQILLKKSKLDKKAQKLVKTGQDDAGNFLQFAM